MKSPEGLFGVEEMERVNSMEFTVTPAQQGCVPWWFPSNL